MKLYFEKYLTEDWSQGIIVDIVVSNDSIDKLMNIDSGYISGKFMPVIGIPACDQEGKSIYGIVGRDSLRYQLRDKNNVYHDLGSLSVDNTNHSTITIDAFDDEVKYVISGGLSTLRAVVAGKQSEDRIKKAFRYIIELLTNFGFEILSAKADIYVGGHAKYGNPSMTVDLL